MGTSLRSVSAMSKLTLVDKVEAELDPPNSPARSALFPADHRDRRRCDPAGATADGEAANGTSGSEVRLARDREPVVAGLNSAASSPTSSFSNTSLGKSSVMQRHRLRRRHSEATRAAIERKAPQQRIPGSLLSASTIDVPELGSWVGPSPSRTRTVADWSRSSSFVTTTVGTGSSTARLAVRQLLAFSRAGVDLRAGDVHALGAAVSSNCRDE